MENREYLVIEHLARSVLLAQQLREASFDKKASDNGHSFEDQEKYYGKSLFQAAEEAALANKLGTLPVYLLCKHSWTESREWALGVLETSGS